MEKNETKVVNIRFQDHDVYIGRGSKWGNPFKIGRDGNRKEVIDKYEKYIREKPELLKDLDELKNCRIGCFCFPLFCHGDILIKLIKEKEENEK